MIEFIELPGSVARELDSMPWPDDTIVVVMMEDGKVIGRSAIMNMPMIEGSFVAEEKRGTSAALRLLKRVEQLYQLAGKTHAMAFAHVDQPEIASYLERVGYVRQPLVFYSKELECQQSQ